MPAAEVQPVKVEETVDAPADCEAASCDPISCDAAIREAANFEVNTAEE